MGRVDKKNTTIKWRNLKVFTLYSVVIIHHQGVDILRNVLDLSRFPHNTHRILAHAQREHILLGILGINTFFYTSRNTYN